MSDIDDPLYTTTSLTSWSRSHVTALGNEVYHGRTLDGREITVVRDNFGNLSATSQGDTDHQNQFGMTPIRILD